MAPVQLARFFFGNEVDAMVATLSGRVGEVVIFLGVGERRR